MSKIFASTETLRLIQDAPLLAILKIVELDWRLSSEVRDIFQRGLTLQKPVRIVLPSQCKLKPREKFIDAPNFFKAMAVLKLTNLQQCQNLYFL